MQSDLTPGVLMHTFCLAVVLLLGCAPLIGIRCEDVASPLAKTLEQRMYTRVQPAVACVRLLNKTEEVGCAASGGKPVGAPLLKLTTALDPIEGERVVVVPVSQLQDFLHRYQHDSALRASVTGILVDPTGLPPEEFSPADSFPLAAHALYSDKQYVWNPFGSGLSRQHFDLPILLLDNSTAVEALRRALFNNQQGFKGAVHMAELGLTMQGTANSSHCISRQTCQPLGGHSVWAAMPPLLDEVNGTANMPLTLVAASIDTAGLFHGAATGADAPLSGLIAMLAAADVLHQAGLAHEYQRHLVFTGLTGETWDYMGSKRLLWEMHNGKNSTQGLLLDKIQQVVEISQVGRSADISSKQVSLFLHHQRGAGFGGAGAIVEAFNNASATATDLKVEVLEASAANPGLPPASLTSFLRMKPSIAGVVIAEFDTAFTNPFYEGRFDGERNINADAITATAVVVAQALHNLATGPNKQLPTLQVNTTATLELVEALIGCLVRAQPGLDCPLVQGGVSTYAAAAEHYVSVLQPLTADSQDPDPNVKNNIERFLFNFLALRTAQGSVSEDTSNGAVACDPYKLACRPGYVCADFRPALGPKAGLGHCVRATARYVPAYSLAVRCVDCKGPATALFPWEVTDDAAGWESQHSWPQDAFWTESNWQPDMPSLLIYQREVPGLEWRLLARGVFATAATVAAALLACVMYDQQQKKR